MNDRRLTDAEKDTLVAWTKSGAKEGNVKDAPPAREFADGWKIGKPDLVLDIGTEYKVPAKGTVEYTYFMIPTGLTEDRWVKEIEVRPTARAVVHHAVLFSRTPQAKGMFLPKAQPGEGFVPKQGSGPKVHKPDEGEGSFYLLNMASALEVVSVYVPGGDPYVTRPDQARLLRAGSDLILQMHYTANGSETVDRSKVGIVFAKEPPKERVINTFVANERLHIPPGDPNWRVVARATMYADAKVQGFFPHMHLRGKAMEYKAIYPTGETEILLSVPKYDFNWQMTYQLAKPLLLPKGTTVEVSAWYDNSPNNPSNPDPKSDVYWGEQSWEEMLAGFIDFVIPADMNPTEIAVPKKAVSATAGLE